MTGIWREARAVSAELVLGHAAQRELENVGHGGCGATLLGAESWV